MPSPLDDPEQPAPSEVQGGSVVVSNVNDDQPPQPLAIDFGEASGESGHTQDPTVQTMDLGEDNVIKLDSLGPMIVNSDGTLSRIQNWYELTDAERERTVRLLVKKRNLVRMEKIKAEQEGGDSSTSNA